MGLGTWMIHVPQDSTNNGHLLDPSPGRLGAPGGPLCHHSGRGTPARSWHLVGVLLPHGGGLKQAPLGYSGPTANQRPELRSGAGSVQVSCSGNRCPARWEQASCPLGTLPPPPPRGVSSHLLHISVYERFLKGKRKKTQLPKLVLSKLPITALPSWAACVI